MKIPVSGEKNILNQEEVIVHFGLSRRKFYKLLKEGKDTPFMALYGTRRLNHPHRV